MTRRLSSWGIGEDTGGLAAGELCKGIANFAKVFFNSSPAFCSWLVTYGRFGYRNEIAVFLSHFSIESDKQVGTQGIH